MIKPARKERKCRYNTIELLVQRYSDRLIHLFTVPSVRDIKLRFEERTEVHHYHWSN